MIKAIIIDDELHCVNALKNDIRHHCPGIELLATANSAVEGIKKIREYQPDLVFLDIEMRDMNGFEMLEILGEQITFKVIFTTAYAQFAIAALRLNALDYLLKPIDEQELLQAVLRVEKSINLETSSSEKIRNALLNAKLPMEEQKIAFATRDGYDFVTPKDILYCQGDGAYTKIFLIDGKQLLISKSLGEIELVLPPALFLRVHHSSIININYISQFKKSDGTYLIMANGDKVNVARSRKEQLLRVIGLTSK